MTEFEQSSGDKSVAAQLAASRDGEERGAIWRGIILDDPKAFEAELKYTSETILGGDIEELIDQVNGPVADEAVAAADKARNPDS